MLAIDRPTTGSEAGALRDDAPHAFDIAQRRRAEEPLVLAAEVRGVVVAHAVAGARRVEALTEHQPAGLLQPQLLLELQRAHRGDLLEVVVEARGAHPEFPG